MPLRPVAKTSAQRQVGTMSAEPVAKPAVMEPARIASMGAVRSFGMAMQAGIELEKIVTRPTTMAVPRLMPMPRGRLGRSGPRKMSVASETEKRMVRNQQSSAVGTAGRMSFRAKSRWIFGQLKVVVTVDLRGRCETDGFFKKRKAAMASRRERSRRSFQCRAFVMGIARGIV